MSSCEKACQVSPHLRMIWMVGSSIRFVLAAPKLARLFVSTPLLVSASQRSNLVRIPALWNRRGRRNATHHGEKEKKGQRVPPPLAGIWPIFFWGEGIGKGEKLGSEGSKLGNLTWTVVGIKWIEIPIFFQKVKSEKRSPDLPPTILQFHAVF